MADLDSIAKRRSHLHLLKPYSADVPWPTLVLGDIDQADRQHFAWLYSGILAAAASSSTLLAMDRGTFRRVFGRVFSGVN